jgi:3-methylcrotonyl-CoA carboxylase alpha subunit
VRHPGVLAGAVDTGLIARDQAMLCAEPATDALDWAAAALVALGLDAPGRDGWQAWGRALCVAELEHAGAVATVRLAKVVTAWLADTPAGAVTVAARRDGTRLVLDAGDLRRTVAVAVARGAVSLMREGTTRRFVPVDPLARGGDAAAAGDSVRAPMPGLVKAVHVAAGDTVEAGARLVTLEAMKMEHALRAPRAGAIAAVPVEAGDQVEEGALLAALEAE